MDMWETELDEAERDRLLDQAASLIQRRGLVTPAILMLEMHRPLAGVSAQMAVAFAPFLVPIVGFDSLNDYSRLLRDPENVERLLKRLESPPSPESSAPPAASSLQSSVS